MSSLILIAPTLAHVETKAIKTMARKPGQQRDKARILVRHENGMRL